MIRYYTKGTVSNKCNRALSNTIANYAQPKSGEFNIQVNNQLHKQTLIKRSQYNNNNNHYSQRHYHKNIISSSAQINNIENNERNKNSISKNNKKILSVAIVGSGPSGMYTGKYLRSSFLQKLKQVKDTTNDNTTTNENSVFTNYKLEISIIEKLPIPYGLVRYGVAPDHPEVKNVENDFASLFTDKTNNDNASIQYAGNVEVGNDISLTELCTMYDAVVLAYGCDEDNKLGIQNENNLNGIISARKFVAWYNGHPDYAYLGSTISKLLKKNVNDTKVVIIGQGNVALDCARILAKGGTGLSDTDIAKHAIPILKDGVGDISILGRRGHVQGAFTIKELRELTKLKEKYNTNFIVTETELKAGMTKSTQEELKSKTARPKIRISKLLHDVSTTINSSDSSIDGTKNIKLRFLIQPIKFLPKDDSDDDDGSSKNVGYVQCQITKLIGEPFQQKAIPVEDKIEILDADIVIVSIGYKSIPIKGIDNDSMFDKTKGKVKHTNGKIQCDEYHNLYASGWLKRGANGIIGTNISDAKETVDTIMKDFTRNLISSSNDKENACSNSSHEGLTRVMKERNVTIVDWNGWYNKINKEELHRGQVDGRIREKIVNVEDMLKIVKD